MTSITTARHYKENASVFLETFLFYSGSLPRFITWATELTNVAELSS